MEEDIFIIESFLKNKEILLKHPTWVNEKTIQAIEKLIKKNKEQEKIIELAIDELYLFNAYDCDYSDLKEHTCTKNDDDKVEIQKAKCKKCIRKIIEKKAKGD